MNHKQLIESILLNDLWDGDESLTWGYKETSKCLEIEKVIDRWGGEAIEDSLLSVLLDQEQKRKIYYPRTAAQVIGGVVG